MQSRRDVQYNTRQIFGVGHDAPLGVVVRQTNKVGIGLWVVFLNFFTISSIVRGMVVALVMILYRYSRNVKISGGTSFL